MACILVQRRKAAIEEGVKKLHLCLCLVSTLQMHSLICFHLSQRLERVVQQCCLFVPIRQNSSLPFLSCLVSFVSPTHSRWLKPSVFERSALYIPCVVTSLSACETVGHSLQRAHSAVSHEHVKGGIVHWIFKCLVPIEHVDTSIWHGDTMCHAPSTAVGTSSCRL